MNDAPAMGIAMIILSFLLWFYGSEHLKGVYRRSERLSIRDLTIAVKEKSYIWSGEYRATGGTTLMILKERYFESENTSSKCRR